FRYCFQVNSLLYCSAKNEACNVKNPVDALPTLTWPSVSIIMRPTDSVLVLLSSVTCGICILAVLGLYPGGKVKMIVSEAVAPLFTSPRRYTIPEESLKKAAGQLLL